MNKFEIGKPVRVIDQISRHYRCIGTVHDIMTSMSEPTRYILKFHDSPTERYSFFEKQLEHVATQIRGNAMSDTTVGKSRGLFEIYAVSLKDDKVVFEQKVVAEGEKEALFESDLKEGLKKLEMCKDDVHIVVREIGPVPPKEKTHVVKLLDKVCEFVKGK
jgi:hypothetical protein